MAIGAIAGGLAIGGILGGGGGPRAPRMSGEQKELMMSQANLNNALADMARQGGRGVGGCCDSLFGQRCPACGGPLACRGMNGAFGGGGFPYQGPYDSLGAGFNADFGVGFGNGGGYYPPQSYAGFNLGVNLRF